MKNAQIAALLLGGILLTGCLPPRSAAEPAQTASEAVTAEPGRCLEPLPPDAFSQALYDELQSEWDAWDRLPEERKLVSSRFPGDCAREFDDWAACEAFLGVSLSNPFEECPWLETGTYVGTPEGFYGAPHVLLNWFGTRDGRIDSVWAQTGYRSDPLRLTLDVALFGQPADLTEPNADYSEDFGRKSYLANLEQAPLQIVSHYSERAFACRAYLAQGPALYCISAIGEPEERELAEQTLEEAVAFFLPEGRDLLAQAARIEL